VDFNLPLSHGPPYTYDLSSPTLQFAWVSGSAPIAYPVSYVSMSSNYSTQFESVHERVSAEEWQARVDLAACYRLMDKFCMADLIYNHPPDPRVERAHVFSRRMDESCTTRRSHDACGFGRRSLRRMLRSERKRPERRRGQELSIKADTAHRAVPARRQ